MTGSLWHHSQQLMEETLREKCATAEGPVGHSLAAAVLSELLRLLQPRPDTHPRNNAVITAEWVCGPFWWPHPLSHSLCVSRPPGKPAASLQREHRPRRVLRGVLQELRGEVQEVRAAVGEARRQALRAAGLAASRVMVVVVVVVSVRHHPSHQRGHRVFNFADHHESKRSARRKEARRDVGSERTRENNAQPVIISGSVFSSSVPCDSFHTAARDVFLLPAERSVWCGLWSCRRLCPLRRQGGAGMCQTPHTAQSPKTARTLHVTLLFMQQNLPFTDSYAHYFLPFAAKQTNLPTFSPLKCCNCSKVRREQRAGLWHLVRSSCLGPSFKEQQH